MGPRLGRPAVLRGLAFLFQGGAGLGSLKAGSCIGQISFRQNAVVASWRTDLRQWHTNAVQ